MISENTVALETAIASGTQAAFVLAMQSSVLRENPRVEFQITAANPIYRQRFARPVPWNWLAWLHDCLPWTFVELVVGHAHQCIAGQQPVTFEAMLELEQQPLVIRTILVPVVEAGQVVQIVGLCQDTAGVQQSQQEVHLWRSTALAISSAPDFPTALSRVMRQICLVTGWVFAEAWVVNPAGTHLVCSESWYAQPGYSPDGGDEDLLTSRYLPFQEASRTIRLAPGEDLPGKVWVNQQPEWVANVFRTAAPEARRGAGIAAGLETGLAIPILIQGEVAAVITFFRQQVCPQDTPLMGTIAAIAAQLAPLLTLQQTAAALHRTEQKYRDRFESAIVGLYQATPSGRYITANSMLAKILGYDSPSELIAMVTTMQHMYVEPGRREAFVALFQERDTLSSFESQVYRKDGSLIWITENAQVRRDATGQILQFEGSVEDITARRHADATLHYQAFHDPLTGLPNRMLFNDRLQLAIANAHRNNQPLAVIFLDLDRFKNINDTLGHAIGDLLLQTVAQRVAACLRESDTISRWGGDEFTIILPQITESEDATKAAQRILESLRPAFYLDGHELYISGSLGIALYPCQGDDAQTLLKHADAALYHVKEQGRNAYQVYTPEISSKATERLLLENNLHHALERGELVICYQPQVNISTWEVTAMEALVRWQHPSLGTIAPNVFIPLAEDAGLIGAIDEWVIHTACAQYKSWQRLGTAPHRLIVNLSTRRFQQPQLVPTIARILADVAVAPQCLEIEITETTAMQNVDFTTTMLHDLHKMGIHISLDDFGTGYSSLSYLKKFPLHTIKIDQSFIQELPTNSDDVAIARSVIALGQGLNLNVVAEGVETIEQLECLQSLHCDGMQGYLFSEPVPPEAATQFLRTHSRAFTISRTDSP
jgi:diguanylate cyclase (GGDEF)-like protein/PAS domain S-box-containing protein